MQWLYKRDEACNDFSSYLANYMHAFEKQKEKTSDLYRLIIEEV